MVSGSGCSASTFASISYSLLSCFVIERPCSSTAAPTVSVWWIGSAASAAPAVAAPAAAVVPVAFDFASETPSSETKETNLEGRLLPSDTVGPR